MEKLGLVVNMKRIIRTLIMLVIGLSLMFYGIIGYFYQQKIVHSDISDREIIERAKALGMVEQKELGQ